MRKDTQPIRNTNESGGNTNTGIHTSIKISSDTCDSRSSTPKKHATGPTTVHAFIRHLSTSHDDEADISNHINVRKSIALLCCTLLAVLVCTSCITLVTWQQYNLHQDLQAHLAAQGHQHSIAASIPVAAAFWPSKNGDPVLVAPPSASAEDAAPGVHVSSSDSSRPSIDDSSSNSASNAHLIGGDVSNQGSVDSSAGAIKIPSNITNANDRLAPLFDLIETIRPLAPWRDTTHKSSRPRGPASYIGLCAIVKDQADDLLEWIEWHRCLGVQMFYIYDNNSSRPLMDNLWPYIQAGIVEYTYTKGWQHGHGVFTTSRQYHAYDDCSARYRGRHVWLGFIDVDEFIVVKPNVTQGKLEYAPDLFQFLQPYQDAGGLVVNWRMFGSSGHRTRPHQPVTQAYTKAFPESHPEHMSFKSLGNTQYMQSIHWTNPHQLALLDPSSHPAVDQYHNAVPGLATRNPPDSSSRISLHHYVLKSEEEFAGKIARRSPDGSGKGWDYFEAVDRLATVECEDAVLVAQACRLPEIVRKQQEMAAAGLWRR